MQLVHGPHFENPDSEQSNASGQECFMSVNKDAPEGHPLGQGTGKERERFGLNMQELVGEGSQ